MYSEEERIKYKNLLDREKVILESLLFELDKDDKKIQLLIESIEENRKTLASYKKIIQEKNNEIQQKKEKVKQLQEEIQLYNRSSNKKNNISSIKIEKTKKLEKRIGEEQIQYNDILACFKNKDYINAQKKFNLLTFKEEKYIRLSREQKINLLFIGYISKGSNFGVGTIMRDKTLGTSYETILFKRLYEGKELLCYLNDNINNFTQLDYRIREDILNSVRIECKKINKNTKKKVKNVGSVLNSTLRKESMLKKLGYSSTLARSVRWNILINKGIPKMGIKEVVRQIEFNINMHKNKKEMQSSVAEWKYDLGKLKKMR